MSYQSPGERRRASERAQKLQKDLLEAKRSKSQIAIHDMAYDLVDDRPTPGERVEIVHRLPKILGYVMIGDSVIRPGSFTPGYKNMPYGWRAAQATGLTEGWLLPHVASTRYISDSRYPDGGSGGNPVNGVLTAEGKIYLDFEHYPQFGGFAVYASFRRTISIDRLPASPELESTLRALTTRVEGSS